MTNQNHEAYEILVMKAVDDQLSEDEQRQLDEHLKTCKDCREELMDFQAIKDTTDQVRQRILSDATIEPFRETPAVRSWNRLNFLLIALGVTFLFGLGTYQFFLDPKIPWYTKAASGTAGAGLLGLFMYILRVRIKGQQHDPYREIDI